MLARQLANPEKVHILLAVAWLLVLVACSSELEENQSTRTQAAAVRATDPRPSVILVVLDTLRADAVSSYGVVKGTTPALDRLAEGGIRYSRAYAPAPWTVSSHTTLFSGLRVDQHGVGLEGGSVAPGSLQMLAETFHDAGYLTAGFSENTLVSAEFGFDQGFDLLEAPDVLEVINAAMTGDDQSFDLGLIDRVRRWDRRRDKSLPFFLFVNIFDAHDPYEVRKVNPWVSENVSQDEVEFIQSRYPISTALCGGVPERNNLEVLRGLYLGDVAAADSKLEELLQVFDLESNSEPHLIVTTSDHGEHLGENRLMGHQFSVRHPALHIPLIVSGLPNVAATTIERPVELRQVHDSLLCWALGEACATSLPVTKPLELLESETSEPIFSIYSDSIARLPKRLVDQLDISDYENFVDPARSKCNAVDRVFGDMVSMIRYPMKITWFGENDPVLHDLSWDPAERFDQMELQPERASRLFEELEEFVRLNVVLRDRQEVPELSEEAVRALKSLGYLQ